MPKSLTNATRIASVAEARVLLQRAEDAPTSAQRNNVAGFSSCVRLGGRDLILLPNQRS